MWLQSCFVQSLERDVQGRSVDGRAQGATQKSRCLSKLGQKFRRVGQEGAAPNRTQLHSCGVPSAEEDGTKIADGAFKQLTSRRCVKRGVACLPQKKKTAAHREFCTIGRVRACGLAGTIPYHS